MPKVSPIQTAFNAGEISPLMYGRVDFEKYGLALARCFNSIPMVQGGVTRRPGFAFSAEVKDSSKKTRVIRFEFSTTQAYVIELGDQYMRLYRNNGPVLETAQNITGITKANPAVLTYSGADNYANGDHVMLSSIGGMTELNGRRVKVAGVDTGANTFQLQDLAGNNIDSTNFTTYTSGGTVEEVYTVSTPWVEADLFALKFAQSADVLYVVHPSYAPRKISRTGHTSWSISLHDFIDGPYLVTNSTTTTLTLGATSGTGVSLTASSATGINGGTGFRAGDVGRHVRIKHSSKWGWGKIASVTNSTTATIDIVSAFGATTASASWRLGVYNTVDGYPGALAFFEDRLGFGGAGGAPQRVDLSMNGLYDTFSPTVLEDGTVKDDNAVSATFNSGDVQLIRWMSDDEKGLLVGTVSGEWVLRPSTLGEALSPTNVKASQITKRGSYNIQAARVSKATLFAQRAGRKLHEIAYDYYSDGFKSPDMTVLAEHITRGGVKEMSFQQQPQSVLWVARLDGDPIGLTYEREQNVIAWHQHELGGFSDSGHTAAAQIESVTTIPSADETREEVWAVIKRYVNGRAVRYVEYMAKMWEDGDDQEDAFYFDCGATYDGSPTTVVSGLWHLVGETISILADGAAHPDKTVGSNGRITLDRQASVVQIGYGYYSEGQLLRNNAGAADGTAQGKTQRAHKVAARFHKSLNCKVGPSFDKLDEVIFRTGANPLGAMVPLYSGDKVLPYEGDYTTANQICWRFYGGLPGTILAFMPQQHTQDA
ncbi:MAG: hypothetical protein KG075_09540 [Alphaproteobacteria bacterium]|nr:hypothetical protein [Alphaproteobacteria bacterium]